MKRRVKISKPCMECGGPINMKPGGEFEPHMMYNHANNQEQWVNSYEDHLALKDQGWEHSAHPSSLAKGNAEVTSHPLEWLLTGVPGLIGRGAAPLFGGAAANVARTQAPKVLAKPGTKAFDIIKGGRFGTPPAPPTPVIPLYGKMAANMGGSYMEEGGNWIPDDLEKGRCTPGSPNYDCPKGSPQYNLKQYFAGLHAKKKFGGDSGVAEQNRTIDTIVGDRTNLFKNHIVGNTTNAVKTETMFEAQNAMNNQFKRGSEVDPFSKQAFGYKNNPHLPAYLDKRKDQNDWSDFNTFAGAVGNTNFSRNNWKTKTKFADNEQAKIIENLYGNYSKEKRNIEKNGLPEGPITDNREIMTQFVGYGEGVPEGTQYGFDNQGNEMSFAPEVRYGGIPSYHNGGAGAGHPHPDLDKGLGYDYNTGEGNDYGLYTGRNAANWSNPNSPPVYNPQNQSIDDGYKQYLFEQSTIGSPGEKGTMNPNTLSQQEWYKAGKPSGSTIVKEELVEEGTATSSPIKDSPIKDSPISDSSIRDYKNNDEKDMSAQIEEANRGNVAKHPEKKDTEKTSTDVTTQGSGSQTPYNVLYPKQGLFNRNKAPLYWNADDTYLKSVDEKYRRALMGGNRLKRRKLEFDHYLPGQGPFPTQEEKENPFIKTEDIESTKRIYSTEGDKQQDIDANDPAGTNTNQGNPEGTGPGAMKGSAGAGADINASAGVKEVPTSEYHEIETEDGTTQIPEGTNMEDLKKALEGMADGPAKDALREQYGLSSIEGINEASLEELYAARDGVDGGGAGAIELGAEDATAQIQARIDELEAAGQGEGISYTEDPNNPGQMIEGTFEDIYNEANAPVIDPTGYQNIPSEGGPYAESTADLERQKQIFDNMQSQLTRPEGSTDIKAQYDAFFQQYGGPQYFFGGAKKAESLENQLSSAAAGVPFYNDSGSLTRDIVGGDTASASGFIGGGGGGAAVPMFGEQGGPIPYFNAGAEVPIYAGKRKLGTATKGDYILSAPGDVMELTQEEIDQILRDGGQIEYV